MSNYVVNYDLIIVPPIWVVSVFNSRPCQLTLYYVVPVRDINHTHRRCSLARIGGVSEIGLKPEQELSSIQIKQPIFAYGDAAVVQLCPFHMNKETLSFSLGFHSADLSSTQ